MRFVTDDAIERLMLNNKNTFLTQKKWGEAQDEWDKKWDDAKKTLPTHEVTIAKKEDMPQVIQSDASYTETLRQNFKEQPRITDVAPSQVGFSVISDDVAKRSSEVRDVTGKDGRIVETDNYVDTHYSAIALSNQQHNGMGQERRDIESSAMVYVGGGTAAFVAKAKTRAAAGHLALYEGKEAEQFGTETNTIYVAPEIGMTMSRDTAVNDDRFSAAVRYDAQSLQFTGKRKYKVNDNVKGEGASSFLSAEKLELKTPHSVMKIDAAGFELNGVRREFDSNQVYRVEVSLEAPEKILSSNGSTIEKYFVRITSPIIDGKLSEVRLKKETNITLVNQTLRQVQDVEDITVAIAPNTCYLIMNPNTWTEKVSKEIREKKFKYYIVITNPIQD